MRLGTSTDTFKLGVLPKGEIVDRIASLNGFDLIRYDDQLAFVSEEFTKSLKNILQQTDSSITDVELKILDI